MKTIDHYEYWNKNRKQKRTLYHREKLVLSFIKKLSTKSKYFIDAGCGHGDFLFYIQKLFPELKIKGLDYSKKEVQEARKNGFDVIQSDFEEGINLKSEIYDIAYAGELIEHLYNPDIFLSEMNRILKKGGYLILSTPNLCAWFNRILLLLGIQPLFVEMSTKSKLVGSGPLKGLKDGSRPVGHIRIFTIDAIKDLLVMNGFKFIEVKGASYEEGLPKWLLPFDRLVAKMPRLAPQMVVLAQKIK
ncbi:MAG: class I SAM-dependent methyltransferase [Nanoarchaeota archaeon]